MRKFTRCSRRSQRKAANARRSATSRRAELGQGEHSEEEGSKRAKVRDKYGFDVKFAYHVVRLLNEAEQILLEGDLDLMRNREQLKSIRRGEWTEQQIVDYFEKKRVDLEQVRAKSTLSPGPDVEAIRAILLQCLEAHYGSLDRAIIIPGRAEKLLKQIKELIEKAGA